MFIINENHPPILKDYGINIPVDPARFIECKNWIKNNIKPENITFLAPETTTNELALVHNKKYLSLLDKNPQECIRECFELNQTPERFTQSSSNLNLEQLAARIIHHANGTYETAKKALNTGHAFFVGGGYHHAMSDRPSGFCLVNDIVLAIRKLQKEKLICSAWVIDVDAHMGDGTAEITHGDGTIITLSIHMKHGWPLDQRKDHLITSDIDIDIAQGEESQYCSKLKKGLEELTHTYPLPELIIFNQGSDPYEEDDLKSSEQLKLNLEQMLERDMILYEFAEALKVPAAYVMSGGYGPKAHLPTIQFWQELKARNQWQ